MDTFDGKDFSEMKQIVQMPGDQSITVCDVPVPAGRKGFVVARVSASLISAGTERTATKFASQGLFSKARSRPDLVKQVLSKVRTDGVLPTIKSVQGRLKDPVLLGYSCSGTVIEVGSGVTDLRPGDRVACAGSGYALHAEVVAVPRNLVALVPSGSQIKDEEAAFSTVGSIALHGFRLTGAGVGNSVGVIGLGLIGLIAVQIAKAAGCSVIGYDPDRGRCQLAEGLGCHAVASQLEEFQAMLREIVPDGCDSVLIAASTLSNQPVTLAGEIAREQGVIVALGAVGTSIPRNLYYRKELTFKISRSYGPGRYDPDYEEKGRDYPISYVRWTENRNMVAFMDMLSRRQVSVQELISHRFSVDQAEEAFSLLSDKARETSLAIILEYPEVSHQLDRKLILTRSGKPVRRGSVRLGLIGAGGFSKTTLLPTIKNVRQFELVGLCSATGPSACQTGERFGFRFCSTDTADIFHSSEIDSIAIVTRNDLHSFQIEAGLRAGKNVFCEKPFCLNTDELISLWNTCLELGDALPVVMVGFNRRFAPLAKELKTFLGRGGKEPLFVHYRVNAGYLPKQHWTQDPEQGGRVIGEVCHFVDFLSYLIGSGPAEVEAQALPNRGVYSDDNVVLTLRYKDGSIGTISYLANGASGLAKERVEVFSGRRCSVLKNFRMLEMYDDSRVRRTRSRFKQDKGHRQEMELFAEACLGTQAAPLSLHDIGTTTLTTFLAVESLKKGRAMSVDLEKFLSEHLAAKPNKSD